jgi:hypothetical protein
MCNTSESLIKSFGTQEIGSLSLEMVRKEEFFVELFLEFIAVVLLDFIPGF